MGGHLCLPLHGFSETHYEDPPGKSAMECVLGHGSFGIVFLKTRKPCAPKSLPEELAVKMLNVKLKDPGFDRSTEKGMKALWQYQDELNSLRACAGAAHIVRYYAESKTSDGSPLIFMEYCEFSLVKYREKYIGMDRGIANEELLFILAQLTLGLQFAKENG